MGSTIGFLSDWQRLNTAITRAKYSLWVVGNRNTLITDPEWRRYLDYLVRTGSCTRYLNSNQVRFDGICKKMEVGEINQGNGMILETLRQSGLSKLPLGGSRINSQPYSQSSSSSTNALTTQPPPPPSSFNYMLSTSDTAHSGHKRSHDGKHSSYYSTKKKV